ncbi:MAG: hypothetical protein D6741_11460, partial [Planctomycetota bacterium]
TYMPVAASSYTTAYTPYTVGYLAPTSYTAYRPVTYTPVQPVQIVAYRPLSRWAWRPFWRARTPVTAYYNPVTSYYAGYGPTTSACNTCAPTVVVEQRPGLLERIRNVFRRPVVTVPVATSCPVACPSPCDTAACTSCGTSTVVGGSTIASSGCSSCASGVSDPASSIPTLPMNALPSGTPSPAPSTYEDSGNVDMRLKPSVDTPAEEEKNSEGTKAEETGVELVGPQFRQASYEAPIPYFGPSEQTPEIYEPPVVQIRRP